MTRLRAVVTSIACSAVLVACTSVPDGVQPETPLDPLVVGAVYPLSGSQGQGGSHMLSRADTAVGIDLH